MKKEYQTNLPFNCKDNWSHSKTNFVSHTVKDGGTFFFFGGGGLYAPLGADDNYNDIMNRESLLRSSELFRQEIENASNI